MKNFTKLISEAYEEQVSEERWQSELKERLYMEERGFAGDEDTVLFGLETMEDELTMEQARVIARTPLEMTHRMTIPIGSATPAERRQSREADIDNMTHPEWDRED